MNFWTGTEYVIANCRRRTKLYSIKNYENFCNCTLVAYSMWRMKVSISNCLWINYFLNDTQQQPVCQPFSGCGAVVAFRLTSPPVMACCFLSWWCWWWRGSCCSSPPPLAMWVQPQHYSHTALGTLGHTTLAFSVCAIHLGQSLAKANLKENSSMKWTCGVLKHDSKCSYIAHLWCF